MQERRAKVTLRKGLGGWFWRFVARNGKLHAHAESYDSKANAERGAQDARDSMVDVVRGDAVALYRAFRPAALNLVTTNNPIGGGFTMELPDCTVKISGSRSKGWKFTMRWTKPTTERYVLNKTTTRELNDVTDLIVDMYRDYVQRMAERAGFHVFDPSEALDPFAKKDDPED